MTDIFISYSKSERAVTEALARKLEAAGYRVWWDTGLVSGDIFKDVILEKLTGAKAVIVIWTKGSINSQWVYAEASRAQGQKKLVPLRTPDVSPDDLPMPFGAIHTDLVTNWDGVRASLDRLGVAPSAGTAGKVETASARTTFGRGRLPAIAVAAGVAVLIAGAGLLAWFVLARAPAPGASSSAPTAIAGPAPVTDCDRLAAAPADSLAVTKGVPVELILPNAVASCEAAVASYPNEVRFWVQLGRSAAKMQDYQKARPWFQKAADAGSSEAMAYVGAFYQFGFGVPGDPTTARAWYEKSAAAGNSDGMTNLAVLYLSGAGVPTDYAKARELFEKAAAGGSGPAMYYLGYIYSSGYGVDRDLSKAAGWYAKGAEASNSASMYALGQLYYNGTGIAKDLSKAAEWYQKAAGLGNPLAMESLAILYENGTGLPKDLAKAKTWYENAAIGGVPAAMVRIGEFYESGVGVTKDYAAARGWYEKAAAANNADGAVYLAVMLDDGSGGPQDFPRAAFLELEAAKHGNVLALEYLRARVEEWSADTRVALEKELARRGFYNGPADGAWGDKAKAAAEAFLKAG